jgi:hypothetical protein
MKQIFKLRASLFNLYIYLFIYLCRCVATLELVNPISYFTNLTNYCPPGRVGWLFSIILIIISTYNFSKIDLEKDTNPYYQEAFNNGFVFGFFAYILALGVVIQ